MSISVAAAIRLSRVGANNGDTQSASHVMLKEEHLEWQNYFPHETQSCSARLGAAMTTEDRTPAHGASHRGHLETAQFLDSHSAGLETT